MIKLSYVISTFNKLEFLSVILTNLFQHVNNDEEIIVIDGGSSDGTGEYLKALVDAGKVNLILSEKDKGEAHGYNKGLLLARGELIKIISDDDAFCYGTIRKCREFMLAHPDIDVMGGNTGNMYVNAIHTLAWAEEVQDDFFMWKRGEMKNFFFNGTSLMIRKSSLPLTGLFNPAILLGDLEFTLRVTGFANVAWCGGLISVRILNDKSNNLKYKERSLEEDKKLCEFYGFKHAALRRQEAKNNRSYYLKTRNWISDLRVKLRKPPMLAANTFKEQPFKEVHEYCLDWMTKHNLNKNPFFTKRDSI